MATKAPTIEEKTELLRQTDIFSTLRPDELAVVAQYSELYRFEADTVIFKSGSIGDELCVIRTGAVVVREDSGAGKKTDLAKFVAGESFGELDLLREKPRTADVVAEGDVEILMFPKKGTKLPPILHEHASIFARVLQKLLVLIADRIRNTNRLISENSPWVRQLRTQVYMDKLTGAYNRAFLDEEVPKRLSSCATYAIFMVKPDNFKAINDTFGHEVGDQAIELYATTLRSNLPEGAMLGRYMSNEMAVVVPDMAPEQVEATAGLLYELVSSIDYGSIAGNEAPKVTYCVGVVASNCPGIEARGAVDAAHETLFEARDQGGDRILIRDRLGAEGYSS